MPESEEQRRGVDYGGGTTNIDPVTRIRYGIIPIHEVPNVDFDDYIGGWADKRYLDFKKQTRESVKRDIMDSISDLIRDPKKLEELADDAFDAIEDELNDTYDPDDNWLYVYGMDGYELEAHGASQEIWVLKSPYYTRAQFCSPCAPGACHLSHPVPDGGKAYCLGSEWFKTSDIPDGQAPYPIYSVETGEPV